MGRIELRVKKTELRVERPELRVERPELRGGCKIFIIFIFLTVRIEGRRPLYIHRYKLNSFPLPDLEHECSKSSAFTMIAVSPCRLLAIMFTLSWGQRDVSDATLPPLKIAEAG